MKTKFSFEFSNFDSKLTFAMYVRQVGAIVLYTYVFHMLAPPPGGSFDNAQENLPVKATSVNGVPEQVPLLTSEELEQTETINSAKEQVRRLYLFCSHECECLLSFFKMVKILPRIFSVNEESM